MADDRIHALPAVRRRLGNPVARVLLQFVTRDDDCGNRLANAIRYYLDPGDDLCWKCRLAGRMVGHTLRRSSDLFGVSEDDIRRGLTETVFLRGLQNVLLGACAGCENKYICGGCRARGWAYSGDIHAPDPGCVNNRDYWESLLVGEEPAVPLRPPPKNHMMPFGPQAYPIKIVRWPFFMG